MQTWIRRSVLIGVVTGVAAATLALAAGGQGPVHVAAPAALPDLEAACLEGQPYVAAVCFPPPGLYANESYLPTVALFRDTAGDAPQFQLATVREVGTVWGLAYSRREAALYAAAFRRRGSRLAAGGIGGIYRVDLSSGQVSRLARVPDAAVEEPRIEGVDPPAAREAGKTGLGDIDLNSDETELFAVNLHDRRIYRFAVPGGQLLGSFAHGAAAEAWAADARPFGLAFAGGLLYHGVVRSAESTGRRAELQAEVYASAPDGSGMRRVAQLPLDYARGFLQRFVRNPTTIGLDWRPWSDTIPPPEGELQMSLAPMPELADLVVDASGDLTLGLRDRFGDMVMPYPLGQEAGVGIGDLLYGRASGDQWAVSPLPEHYRDAVAESDETALGGLAYEAMTGRLLSAHLDGLTNVRILPFGFNTAALWYEPATGDKVAVENICPPGRRLTDPWPDQPQGRPPAIPVALADNEGMYSSLGDLEVLCGAPLTATATAADSATPTRTPLVTPSPSAIPSRTPTATPGATATARPSLTPTATASPTPTPHPLHLPLLLRERCIPGTQRLDAVLVIDASSSMGEPTAAGRTKLAAAVAAAGTFLDQLRLDAGDPAAVVWFNERARLAQPLSDDRAALDAALAGITLAQTTRLDLGIAAARAELAGPRRRTANLALMVVLTDGRANPVPVAVAEAEAQAAKDAGMVLFTIGLGTDLEEDALRRMASRPEFYHAAPDAEALAAIYARIAVAIPCPDDAFWGPRGHPGKPPS